MKKILKFKRRHHLRANCVNPQHFSSGQLKIYAFLVPFCLVTALPLVFIFVNAFKPLDELMAYPPRFYVKNPTFENFRTLLAASSETNIPATRYLFNSIVSVIITVIATIIISVCAGYVLSKKRFRIRTALMEINNLAMMFCGVAVAIPRFLVIANIGILDTFWANIIPLLATPVGVFLVKQFIDGLPDALIEAAIIDGANDFHIMYKIVIPLIKPAISTLTITTFQAAWSATEGSTMLINNETLKTFPFYISTLNSGMVSGQGLAAAATLLLFLPNLIVFIIMQSKVMNTMAHSGIK